MHRFSLVRPWALALAPSLLLLGCGSRAGPTGPGTDFPNLAIQTTGLSVGFVGVAYSESLSASGGNGVYTWSLAEGSPPSGLSLSTDGTISGTPLVAGTSSFIVQVNSGDGQAVTQQFLIEVLDPPPAVAEAAT